MRREKGQGIHHKYDMADGHTRNHCKRCLLEYKWGYHAIIYGLRALLCSCVSRISSQFSTFLLYSFGCWSFGSSDGGIADDSDVFCVGDHDFDTVGMSTDDSVADKGRAICDGDMPEWLICGGFSSVCWAAADYLFRGF